VSVDEERTCVRFGLYLVDDGRRRLALLVRAGNPIQGISANLEVMAPTVEEGRAWLAQLRDERAACNVLRGQVLSFEPSDFEPGVGPVRFHRRPQLGRADVVMPGGVLHRIERGYQQAHTVRYLTGVLTEFTVILLVGPAIRFVAEACALARSLQPSLIVLEDCDLVAEDRSYSPFGNPLLFTVLDEMDGLASDADVCFLLTTNRADLLETALAQRPGRVDLAVELPLPDADGRRRLLDIYGRGIELPEPDVAAVVSAPPAYRPPSSRR
jgi:cell division protease FtsH